MRAKQQMTQPRNRVSWKERLVGLLVLVALAAIGYWIYLQQARFHPAITAANASLSARPLGAEAEMYALSSFLDHLPDDLQPMGPVEQFNGNSLSDKIDGRAELYLSAGFVSLECQRFSSPADPTAWMEMFVYDMGTPRRAFAAYSVQRREDAEPLGLTPFGYQTPNAVFFQRGHFYIEIIAAAATPRAAASIQALASRLLASLPGEDEPMAELEMFPPDHMAGGEIMLLLSNAFGFDRFNEIFSASYDLGGRSLTGFMSSRQSEAEAVDLAKAYRDFLVANGGTVEPVSLTMTNAWLISLFGTYELVFTHGRVLAGVHEAEMQEDAEMLAERMFEKIFGVTP